MLIAGGIASICGMYSLIRRIQFIVNSKVAIGEVQSVEKQIHRNKEYHYPSISFETPQGQSVSFRSLTSASKDIAIGDRIEVRYLIDNPERAFANQPFAIWGLPVTLLILGGLPLYAALRDLNWLP